MAKEYIERQTLLHKIRWASSAEEAVMSVRRIPAADVVEVVHAKWDDNGRCTNCGGHAPYYSMASTYYASPYCFECGAKMDKEVADDKKQPEEAPGE